VTSTLVTATDLDVVKHGPVSLTAGSTVTYTLSVTNHGPSDALNVVLNDVLPTGETLVSATKTGGPDTFTNNSAGNTANFTAAAVAAGAIDVFQLVVAVAPDLAANTTLTDVATVTTTTTDILPINNTASTTATVISATSLSILKTGPATITAGTSVTYSITLTNNGPANAAAVIVTDVLPVGLNLDLAMTTQVSGPDAFTNVSSGNTAMFTATVVGAHNTDVFRVVAAAPATLPNGTVLTDTATASAANAATVSSSVTSAVVSVANLSVTKTGPATVAEGDVVTYTISVTNAGPSDALNVVLTDTLPNDVRVFSDTVGNVTGFIQNGLITFALGTVAAGSTVTGTLVVQPFEDGSRTDTLTATSTTTITTPANLTTRTTMQVTEPPLSLTLANVSVTRFQSTGPIIVATFSHANGVEDPQHFTAVINWGDNTSTAGTVCLIGGTYEVLGQHTYKIANPAPLTVTVSEDNLSVTTSAGVTVNPPPLPSGAAGTALDQHIFETLINLFNAPVTIFQLRGIEVTLMTLEMFAAQTFMSQNGLDAFTALSLAQQLGQQEFDFLAQIMSSNGSSLNSAVNNMATAFVLQSQTELLNLGI
jgi:uncharacterized repeat protein (TIGR01451 family)